jgi:hypothetical protein
MKLIEFLTEILPDYKILEMSSLIIIKKENESYTHDKNTLEYLHSTNQLTREYILKWKQQH